MKMIDDNVPSPAMPADNNNRIKENWAAPVSRLKVTDVPNDAFALNLSPGAWLTPSDRPDLRIRLSLDGEFVY